MCDTTLTRGPRKGEQCGKKIQSGSTCRLHVGGVECPVCFWEKKATDTCTVCGKEICNLCLRRWFKRPHSKRKCPFCRKESTFLNTIYPPGTSDVFLRSLVSEHPHITTINPITFSARFTGGIHLEGFLSMGSASLDFVSNDGSLYIPLYEMEGHTAVRMYVYE